MVDDCKRKQNCCSGGAIFRVKDLTTPLPPPLGVKNVKILKKNQGTPGVPLGTLYNRFRGPFKKMSIAIEGIGWGRE